jgi:hypothetical protein
MQAPASVLRARDRKAAKAQPGHSVLYCGVKGGGGAEQQQQQQQQHKRQRVGASGGSIRQPRSRVASQEQPQLQQQIPLRRVDSQDQQMHQKQSQQFSLQQSRQQEQQQQQSQPPGAVALPAGASPLDLLLTGGWVCMCKCL